MLDLFIHFKGQRKLLRCGWESPGVLNQGLEAEPGLEARGRPQGLEARPGLEARDRPQGPGGGGGRVWGPRSLLLLRKATRRCKFLHCKKRFAIFPSPAGKSQTKLSLAGKN